MSSGELDHIVGMEIQASSENLTELKIAAEKSKSMGQWGGKYQTRIQSTESTQDKRKDWENMI